MLRAFKATLAVAALGMLAGCVSPPPPKDYSAFRHEDPHSIVVVPAVNRSVDVTAANYFLSTISRPVAERGYYVFPVNLVKQVMEDDGLSDADMVHQANPKHLGEMFGADSILYVTIERWDAQYIVFSTTVTVELSYVLKSGKTGETLWQNKQSMVYQPQGNGGGGLAGLVAMAITAAITKAAPDYIPLAQMANSVAVSAPHQGLPAGAYRADYGKDGSSY